MTCTKKFVTKFLGLATSIVNAKRLVWSVQHYVNAVVTVKYVKTYM